MASSATQRHPKSAERLKTPLLFPCAARVKMPQLGSEDSDLLRVGQKTNRLAPDSIVFKNSTETDDPISKDYLKKVSTDLRFEEEVVKERCFHALPYDEKYMYEAFEIGDLISLPAKARLPVGRHNARGQDNRHMPCNLTKTTKSHLKPLRRKITERAQQMHFEALRRQELKEIQRRIIEKQQAIEGQEEQIDERSSEPEREQDDEDKPGVFLTETKPAKDTLKGDQKPGKRATFKEESIVEKPAVKPEPAETVVTSTRMTLRSKSQTKTAAELLAEDEVKAQLKQKHGNEWDAYVISLLSVNTANWIVYEKTPVGAPDREKLENMLKKWYGVPEHTDLVREDMSDNEVSDEEEEKTPRKKWKKKESTLLQRVYQLEEEVEPHALDPYSDDNKAPFYRQPAGLRRAKKHEEKEELVSRMKGAINTTAANIEVQPFKPPPPPTLRDYMNPDVGKYMLETDNMFQQEQLKGTTQVHQAFGDPGKILMDTDNKYKKSLQPGFPQPPEAWFPETDAEKQESARDSKKQKKHHRGHQRWKSLPEPIDDTAQVLNIQPPGLEDSQKSADLKTRKTAKNNASLMQIIDEWRTKWHLTGQFVDSTPDDLIKDMADIQPHVRLKAIATCAKATDYKPPEDHGIQLEFMGKNDQTKKLPEKLFVALECLLDDPVEKVKTAAAITLYSLNRPGSAAEAILYTAMASENPIDRWAAAQCLAHYGVCDSDVVGEILKQVMNTEDTIKHERGISMLGILSISSNLVHAMVAEQLNSSSWRHKVIACKILPTLRGDINRDITNKLSDLMWNDWHAEVRRAAAQCLGKTGHGRDVHDDLRKKILEGDERVKLEALNKVGQLGIMTAKLLPAFLKCFEDEYVAVRSEVCITCGNLAIKDEEVIAKLIHLATFDNIWKIKALAFQALGKIGLITDQIIDCLLWAVRYEENAAVRAEACHTLKAIKVKTEEVADVLQDRFLVESHPMVREELASTLKMFDISLTEDMDMVAQIKKEVQKLCTRNIIATQITLNEQDGDKRDNLARMIYESEKDMKAHETPREPMMERIRSLSRAESHKTETTTPEPFRDAVVFTPTADRELEAILNTDELESGRTSPTSTDFGTTPATTPATTPGTKSRATSASTRVPDGEEDEEDESKSPTKSSEDGQRQSSMSSRLKSAGLKSEEEAEIAKVTLDNERPTSTVKFSAHLEVADIPSRSRSSLGPSRMSLMDEHGKPSRTSVNTTATEGMVFGRDAVLERERINEEVRHTFAFMDERYKDMVQDLIDLDNAFELDLTSGSRQDFEKKIQNVRIVQTPPSSKGAKPKVEIVVKGESDKSSKDKNEKKKQASSTEEKTEEVDKNIAKSDKEVQVKEDGQMRQGEEKETDSEKTESAGTKGEKKLSREQSQIEIVITEAPESDRS